MRTRVKALGSFLKPPKAALHYYDADMFLSLLLLTFVRVNPKLKKLQFRTRTTYLQSSLYLSLVAFQLVGLHYRLCNSINFIITLNEGVGLQLLGQNSKISQRLCIQIVKKLNLGAPWSSIRGPGAPWLSVKGSGAPGCRLVAPEPPSC